MKNLLVVLALALVGCPKNGPGPVPVIGGAVVDCLGTDRPKIDALLGELSPVVMGGHADWSVIYQRAKQAGMSIGGCVLAELVQSYLGTSRASSSTDGWTAHGTLEKFRHEEASNATFKTVCKRQDGTAQTCQL